MFLNNTEEDYNYGSSLPTSLKDTMNGCNYGSKYTAEGQNYGTVILLYLREILKYIIIMIK